MRASSLALFLTAFLPGLPTANDGGKSNPIGYSTVSEALTALTLNPEAVVRVQDGWTIVEVREEKQQSLWSFTPPDHPAHPAALKRTIYEKDGSVMMQTNALCQASKRECDKLMQEFAELERQIRERIKSNGG
jgi:hypothetical protein